MVMVFGEITTKAKVDYEAIVRKTCKEVGFTSDAVGLDGDKCKVPYWGRNFWRLLMTCTRSDQITDWTGPNSLTA